MLRRDEDGLTGDSVHVDACSRLEVVKVDEAIFGDEVNDAVFLGNLHRYREIVCGFRGEVHIHCFLCKDWVRSGVINLYNVKLIIK